MPLSAWQQKHTQPAWDVSERSQSNLHWERHLRDLLEASQIRWLFCDVFKTFQIHLKKDVFFVTSLSISKASQKNVFCVMSLRRLEYISKRCLFRDVSETPQKHLSQVFVIFQKSRQKWFRVISVGYYNTW